MKKNKSLFLKVFGIVALGICTFSLSACSLIEDLIGSMIPEESATEIVLNGANQVEVPLSGTYEEQGAKAYYEGQDISNKIKITYYCGQDKVEAIKTDALLTYTASYTVSYKGTNLEAKRTIEIVEPEIPIVDFRLIGENHVTVGLHSTYIDKGFVATYNTKDVSSDVAISYYLDNDEISEINTDREATYVVKYNLNHKGYTAELQRNVIVSDVDSIEVYFLELGNKYTGDSTFIKTGDTDILIDAGSRQNSATTIADFIDRYCTDGKLEYVIATHAHQDHIAGFVGSNTDQGILKRYKIDTLIDFSLTNATSAIYNNYVSLRDEKIASGDIKHHYTANDCIQGTNGAQKVYDLAPGITMEILDQKFYRETTSDENDYSVCTLFTQGNNNYLFTGDLEKDGEASLATLNNLPEVELFKGGHHGSYTANTDTLLSVIKPKNVCICCCAGSDEYTKTPANMFPAQAAINRIAKYTDKVYVTTVVKDTEPGYQSMNGNIKFFCQKGTDYSIGGSNNDVILKETEWFRNNRTWPTY